MPSPLLFFIFIIIIDLVLKTAKDKKKIEKAKQQRSQEMQRQPEKPKPMQDLKKILEQELEKERQKEIERRQGKMNPSQTTKPKEKEVMVEKSFERSSWDINRDEKNIPENIKPVTIQAENKENDLRKDILRGIIFSEILSEPKSIQNKKRSS